MIESSDPKALRQVYFDAWQKALKQQPLTAMEHIIVDILHRHPEYQPMFNHPEEFAVFQHEKFALDHNPFFHIALHVTIAEQVGANRPQGIRHIYNQLLKKHGDKNTAEHKMIGCLARILMESFEMDSNNNDKIYMQALKRLL